MALTPGTRLGPYEILTLLGAGGMGEVYRARDTRLGRDVAIKALPAEFARDADRLVRFEREAKLLASLSHPHVAGIFGLEEVEGHRYLILEFVEGETLAHRLDRGRLTIDESLQIGGQIAAALESAHENGVAHRDLKPGNVIITPAGDAKVLDFGLAKSGVGSASASDVSLSHSPTLTHQHTGAGVILGTAAYMSPEQARGRAVDKRTDIWAFGCVLYECLTGRQAFAGDTVSDLIARILEREPDWEALPARTPPRIRELLRRCLEKDAKRRLRDIGDARNEIDEVIATKSSGPRAAPASPKGRISPRTLLGVVGLLAITAAATYVVTGRVQHVAPTLPTRFEIAEMPGTHMDFDGVESAISPDGRSLVYCGADSAGVRRLWVRTLESLMAREIPGTENPVAPFWSPDSKSIGFFRNNEKLVKVTIGGGTPETIADVKGPRGGTWNRDGIILYAPFSEGPIYRVSANGGDPVPITTLDSTETAHRFPTFLPDGRRFLYAVLPLRDGRYRIYQGTLDGKEKRLVLDTASAGAVYAWPGYLLYDRDGSVVAQRFGTKNARVVGEPIPLGDWPIGTSFSGAAGVSVATNGTLAYATNVPFATHLVWADRSGKQIGDIPMASGKYIDVELSPSGHEAVLESSPKVDWAELWLVDLERGVVRRLSEGEAVHNTTARWSPNGARIAYTSAPSGGYPRIIVMNVGSGAMESYLEDDHVFKFVYDWTPDSRAIIFGRQEAATRWDIWILPLEGDKQPKPYLVTPYHEDWARVSPDGHWIAYRSDESGQFDIYIQSFPNHGSKHKVTSRGGRDCRWSRDGRELYFEKQDDPTQVYVTDVLPGPPLRLGPSKPIARLPETNFDAEFASGGRVIMLMPARPLPPQTVTIVQNWPALLGKK